jgi:hypothetical protein
MVTAPTLQLLEWIDERQRSYAETMEAWRSSCPRLTIWEDAVADGLVAVRDGSVVVTVRGRELVQGRVERHAGDQLVLAALPAQD